MDKKYMKTLVEIIDVIDSTSKIIGLKNGDDEFLICTDIYDEEIQPQLETICFENGLDYDYYTYPLKKKKYGYYKETKEVLVIRYTFFMSGDVL